MDQIPTWLDQAFVTSLLQGEDVNQSTVKVVKFTTKPAVEEGVNYTSYLYRIRVEYKDGVSPNNQFISLIVKAPIVTGIYDNSMGHANFFEREPVIYKELLPKIFEKVKHTFGPKSFHCPVKMGLVLQDLNEDGYIVCEKSKQLDYEHCKICFTTIAKYHAASVACYHDDPRFIETVGEECIFGNNAALKDAAKPWLLFSIKTVGENLKMVNECKQFADLILSKLHEIWELLVKVVQPKTKGLNVLNHGDLWINNMMFKYNESRNVIDVKFIDFQIARYGSPVIDLIYFIWISANEDVREHRLQELYNIYLQTLNTTLELLGCKERMTSEELQEDLNSAVDWVIHGICHMLPIFIIDPKEAPNLGEFSPNDLATGKANDVFKQLYNGELYNSLLPGYVRQFQNSFLNKC